MSTTFSFQGYAPWTVLPNPFHADPIGTITVRDRQYNLANPLLVRDDDGFIGLSLGYLSQLDLSEPAKEVAGTLAVIEATTIIEAYDEKGNFIGHVPVARSGHAGTFSIAHISISRLVFVSPSNQANLLLLKVENQSGASIRTFFNAGKPVDTFTDHDVCAEVLYGETSALRAPEAEDALVNGRDFIAAVIYARYDDDPTRFAPRQHPTHDELKDPTIRRHWDLCNDSATRGLTYPIGNCFHFVVWPINSQGDGPTDNPSIADPWPYEQKSKIAEKYGPFVSYVYPKSSSTYIFKYCGVS